MEVTGIGIDSCTLVQGAVKERLMVAFFPCGAFIWIEAGGKTFRFGRLLDQFSNLRH